MAIRKETPEKELTAKLVLARSRSESLDSVKRINLWGQGITNISIVERMPDLEIVALSANKISDLSPFRLCQKMKELYLRNNLVANLEEVVYLKDLACLTKLWLSENPCASKENYRETVIRTLPYLTNLDDKEISSEERTLSAQKGIELSLPVINRHAETDDVLNSDGALDSTMQLSNYSELPSDPASGDSLSTTVNSSSFDDSILSTIRLNPSTKSTIGSSTPETSNKVNEIPSKVSTRERSLSCGTNRVIPSEQSPLQTKAKATVSSSNGIIIESVSLDRPTTDNQQQSSKSVETSSTTTNVMAIHSKHQETADLVGTPEILGRVVNPQTADEIREKFQMKPFPLSKLSEPIKSHLPQRDRRDEEVRSAVLHLIEVLEHESLLTVLDAIHERLKKDLVPRDSGSYKKNAYS